MGNLIVKNGTNVDTITEINVNGYPANSQTGLNIPPNGKSNPISLPQGVYDVVVTIKDPDGKITQVTKQVTIPKEGDVILIIPPQPEEPQECKKPNLVVG